MSELTQSQRDVDLCDTLPYGADARHLIHDVIDPADTSDIVIRFLAQSRPGTVIGRHRLAGWPTTF
jgi:hypothetical protein